MRSLSWRRASPTAKRRASTPSGSTTFNVFYRSPDLTIYVDIGPETAVQRKAHDRDRYERDLALLGRVRDSYRRQATQAKWISVDGERAKETIAEEIFSAVTARLVGSTT